MKRIVLTILAASLFLEYGSAIVTLARSEEKPVTLDPIVVTAKEKDVTFQTGDVDLEETTSFYSVITRDLFEGKISNLSDIIKQEAGVQIRQTGGLGSLSTVSLRGSSGDQVVVYIDGIPLNDASGGGVDLSNIALADVESIEIYRGITPVHFGTASMGGVVNIKTLRSRGDFRATTTAGWGSFGTDNHAGYINHKPGNWNYVVAADYLTSKNDYKAKFDKNTPHNPDDDWTARRNNAQIRQKDLLTKAGYDFTDNVRLDLSNQWFEKDQHLPNWINSPEANTTFDTKRNNAFAKCTINNIGLHHFNVSNRWYYSWKKEDYDDSDGYIGLDKQHDQYITRKYGSTLFFEWPTVRQTFTAAGEAYRETYDPRDLLKPIWDKPGVDRDYASLALQDKIFFLDDKLSLTPILRSFYYSDDQENWLNPNGDPQKGDNSSDSYTRPQLGIKYRPLQWVTVKANVAEYVRIPSFFELYGDRGLLIGNPDLNPEEGTNYDAGFELNWKPHHPWLHQAFGNAVWFKRRVSDIIAITYDSQGVGRPKNVSKASIDGVEASLTIDALKFFRFIGNATWQDPEITKSDIKLYKGNQLPGIFKTSLFGRIEATYKTISLYYEYVNERDRYYNLDNNHKARDKTEVNIGASWAFRSLVFSFDGKNITDNQYEDFNGFPLPGEAYYVTVKYEFT
jgi:iron complex outermembrane receptor protein